MLTFIFNGLFIVLFATMMIAFFVFFYFQARAMIAVVKASQLEQSMSAFFRGDLDPDLRRKWGKAFLWWLASFGVLIAVLIAAQALDVLLI